MIENVYSVIKIVLEFLNLKYICLSDLSTRTWSANTQHEEFNSGVAAEWKVHNGFSECKMVLSDMTSLRTLQRFCNARLKIILRAAVSRARAKRARSMPNYASLAWCSRLASPSCMSASLPRVLGEVLQCCVFFCVHAPSPIQTAYSITWTLLWKPHLRLER